jgi:hypothetical protein
MCQQINNVVKSGVILTVCAVLSGCGGANDDSTTDLSISEAENTPVLDTDASEEVRSNQDEYTVALVPDDVDLDWSYGRDQLDGNDLPPFSADTRYTDQGKALIVVGRRDIYQRKKVPFNKSGVFNFKMLVRQSESSISEPIRQLSSFYAYDAEGNSQPFVVEPIEGDPSIYTTLADGWVENNVTIRVTSPNAVWIRPAIRFNFNKDVTKSEVLEVAKLEVSIVE